MSEEKVQTKKTTAPPPAADSSAHAKPAPAKTAAKGNSKDDQETLLWVIGFVVLAGFIVSMIFGTSGMSTTMVDAEILSTVGNAAVVVLSLAAMVHINLMQVAHAFGPEQKKIEFGKIMESLAYYIVDWSMTFAGFTGWVLIAMIMSGESSLGKSIAQGFLIALAAVGAFITSWGTEKLARVWSDMYHEMNGIKPDYKPLRKWLYSTAGWVGLFVSWGAAFFGVFNISASAGVDMQYMPNKVAVGVGAFLLPLMLSGIEYYLLKIKKKSRAQKIALGICFFVDAGVIFGGLGGMDLGVEVILGNITGPDKAMVLTAILSKAFSAYVGSVGGEKPHIDAALIDTEDAPAASETDSHTHDAAATQTTASTNAAPSSSPAAQTTSTSNSPAASNPNHSVKPAAQKTPPPAEHRLTPAQWAAIIDDSEDEFQAFWDNRISPDWYVICLIVKDKKPEPIGCVPQHWVPTDERPRAPEPTYHPVGMGVANLTEKKTPPPPADHQSRYDA